MNITAIVLIASVFAFILYDIYALEAWGIDATISREILRASFSHPIIPLAAGILMGHLFWPQH